jgi:hypothetical protein
MSSFYVICETMIYLEQDKNYIMNTQKKIHSAGEKTTTQNVSFFSLITNSTFVQTIKTFLRISDVLQFLNIYLYTHHKLTDSKKKRRNIPKPKTKQKKIHLIQQPSCYLVNDVFSKINYENINLSKNEL